MQIPGIYDMINDCLTNTFILIGFEKFSAASWLPIEVYTGLKTFSTSLFHLEFLNCFPTGSFNRKVSLVKGRVQRKNWLFSRIFSQIGTAPPKRKTINFLQTFFPTKIIGVWNDLHLHIVIWILYDMGNSSVCFDTFNKVRRWGNHPGRMLGVWGGHFNVFTFLHVSEYSEHICDFGFFWWVWNKSFSRNSMKIINLIFEPFLYLSWQKILNRNIHRKVYEQSERYKHRNMHCK